MQIQITGCMFENMGRNMNTKSKVIVLPCEAYDEERIYTLMKNGLAQLGGLDNLINKEEKILLKPNLLKKAEVEKAVITHPVVVGAFARILHEEGYKNIVLADSCGHGTTKQVIQAPEWTLIWKNIRFRLLIIRKACVWKNRMLSRRRNLSYRKNCWRQSV